tara:strand:- start:5591 stop:6262 length:672 start_codon:yes stop_codon:yes gene_type:complete
MIWPTLCVDRFFINPEAVIKYAKNLKYDRSVDGTWPGKRTAPTHTFDKNFFQMTTKKIVAALYPNEVSVDSCLEWRAHQFFQKIKPSEYKEKGFIHQDLTAEFTSIVYLSNEENNGTFIYNLKKPVKDTSYEKIQQQNYIKPKKPRSKEFKKALEENHNNYEKVLEFKSMKNRMIIFDSSQYHGVNNFGKDNAERLTLITFFNSFTRTDGKPLKYHANECIKY